MNLIIILLLCYIEFYFILTFLLIILILFISTSSKFQARLILNILIAFCVQKIETKDVKFDCDKKLTGKGIERYRIKYCTINHIFFLFYWQ